MFTAFTEDLNRIKEREEMKKQDEALNLLHSFRIVVLRNRFLSLYNRQTATVKRIYSTNN